MVLVGPKAGILVEWFQVLPERMVLPFLLSFDIHPESAIELLLQRRLGLRKLKAGQ
jgi:hypothetical protein